MYISYYINEIIFLVVFENVFDIKNHLFPWTFSRKLRLKQLIGHKFTGLGLEFTGLAHYYRLGSQCCKFAFSVSHNTHFQANIVFLYFCKICYDFTSRAVKIEIHRCEYKYTLLFYLILTKF